MKFANYECPDKKFNICTNARQSHSDRGANCLVTQVSVLEQQKSWGKSLEVQDQLQTKLALAKVIKPNF